MKTTQIVAVLCISLLPVMLQAQVKSLEVLTPEVNQGGVAMIKISPQLQSFQSCVSIFGRQYIPNKYGEVFVGVDINTKQGNYPVFLAECGRGIRLDWSFNEIKILEIKFPEHRINIRKAVVNSRRRLRELEDLAIAYKKSNLFENYTDGRYRMPLDDIFITGPFGSKRIYLDGESYHGGVDLRASIGTPIKAVNSGVVILAANRFSLEGNMVVVDHGSGIFSFYLHLSKIKVKEGDLVKSGQIIGLSGATGDARGPHLHFIVKASGTSVDPLEFIGIMNEHVSDEVK